MYRIVDLRNENWVYDATSGSQGVYMKEVRKIDGKTYYIKLPYYDSVYGFIGTECINEVIAGRLGKCLGLPVLYQYLGKVLVSIDGRDLITYACRSLSYKRVGYDRINAGKLYKLNKIGNEYPIDTFRRIGLSTVVNTYLIWDYLIMGKDRHSGNIEFLSKDSRIYPSPIFDNGVSFLYSIFLNDPNAVKKVKDYDIFKNNTANNFLGSRDLEYNLRYVTAPIKVRKLYKEDRRSIMYNLSGVIPKEYLDKIWSIICYRYLRLRQLGLIVEV